MEEIRGIVLYSIERDNSLNGVYTNSHPSTRAIIFTETARLRQGNLIEGQRAIFDSSYFDFDGINICTLIIEIINGVYIAEWQLQNGTIFRGQGFLMNDRQIAISYWLVRPIE